MKDLRFKLVGKHIKECAALDTVKQGRWPTPWAYITDDVKRLDVRGRKNHGSGIRWRTAKCNDPRCQAAILFVEDDVLALLPKGA